MPPNSVTELRAAAPVRPATRPTVVPYDFRRPTKLSRDNVRSLQVAYDTFARRLTTLLTSGLRQVCQVVPREISQQSYDEFVNGLTTPTVMVPITLPPLSGTATLELSIPVALAAIDHMLGGPGGSQPARTLTDIETSLLRGLLEQVVGVLRYSLEPIVDVHPELGTIEYNPHFLQAASATDAVVVGEFELIVGREKCPMTISIPLASLLPRLIAQRPRTDIDGSVTDGGAAKVVEQLSDVPLDVAVHFRPVNLAPARILSLAPGDVVVLDHRVGAPLSVDSGATQIAQAIAGKSGTRLAALVVDNPVDIKESL